MRVGSRRTLSERDHTAIKERLAFEQAEQQKERDREDCEQYETYLDTFRAEQGRVRPADRIPVLTFEQWREFMPDEPNPALRGQLATAKSLVTRERKTEREAVTNGKDLSIYVAPDLQDARMGLDQAIKFNGEQIRRFRASTPDYYPSQANVAALMGYFERNDIPIMNESMIRAAWERLRTFGLIEERPEPAPEPVEEPQPEVSPEEAKQARWFEYTTTVTQRKVTRNVN